MASAFSEEDDDGQIAIGKRLFGLEDNWSMEPNISPLIPNQTQPPSGSKSEKAETPSQMTNTGGKLLEVNLSSQQIKDFTLSPSILQNFGACEPSSSSEEFSFITQTLDSNCGNSNDLMDCSLPRLSSIFELSQSNSSIITQNRDNLGTKPKRARSPSSQRDFHDEEPPSSKGKPSEIEENHCYTASTDGDGPSPSPSGPNSQIQTEKRDQIETGQTVAETVQSFCPLSEFPSNQENSTIIIEPQPCENNPDITLFFRNEIAIARAIKLSAFGTSGIINVTKNIQRKVLVIKTEPLRNGTLADLLETKQLGNWKIKCRLPKTQTVTYGVIGPLGQDVTNEELTEILIDQGYPVNIALRVKKGKMPTSMFKIEFKGLVLPEYVSVIYERFRVYPHVPQPMQCFNCQIVGHTIMNCTKKTKCVICGGPHGYKNCIDKIAKCANCGGSHTASYGGCKYLKKAKEVEAISAKHRISFNEAKKVAANPPPEFINENLLTTTESSNTTNTSKPSYSSVTRRNLQKTYVTVGCQTDQVTPKKDKTDSLSSVQLAMLIWHMLGIKDSEEVQNQPQALYALIKNTLDVNLTQNDFVSIANNNPIIPTSSVEPILESDEISDLEVDPIMPCLLTVAGVPLTEPPPEKLSLTEPQTAKPPTPVWSSSAKPSSGEPPPAKPTSGKPPPAKPQLPEDKTKGGANGGPNGGRQKKQSSPGKKITKTKDPPAPVPYSKTSRKSGRNRSSSSQV